MKYIINATETVYYQVTVQADSIEEAEHMILSGKVDLPEPNNATDFTIIEYVEVKE